MELDIQNVPVDVQGLKQQHEFETDFSQVSKKKKKVDEKPASDTAEISPWQIESIVEVLYVDLSIDVLQIHTFRNVQKENVEEEQSTVSTRNIQKCNVHKIQMVPVKEEVLPLDSDDVIVTFVEHGFPKRIKQEAQSSSTITRPMKLMSTDTDDQEYQHRVQILAEVHRPQETTRNQSILDHDYVPQKIVEVRSEGSTSGGKTRQEEVQRIKQEDPNPELDVFIPSPAG